MADVLVLAGTGASVAGAWLLHWLRHRYGLW